MKVAINTLFLIPEEVGGSETYLRETLLAIARQYPDIELALVTNRENDDLLRSLFGGFSQCSFHLLPIRATNRYVRIIAEQTRLPWILRRIKPDLLWSPGYTMPFWAPCRQVVSILDMQYCSHPDDLTRIARWTTHVLVLMASRRADRILTISEFSKQEIIRHTGCPPDRIAVTHLGVDPDFGSTKNQEPRTTNQNPYILSVANSYPHKNLHRLVDAFALLLERIPHQLVIVGRPRLGEPQLVKSLSKIPPERVRRIAGLPRNELIDLYQSADLFVFPSLYEGFGLPVLEAMMAGVPVVTTREGSIPEVGGDEVTYADGRDPADLAAKILETINLPPNARQTRIQSARTRAATFTWSTAAKATVEGWRSPKT
jgi:glycosyltransferase involved in cell wall biosynthesis